MNLIDVYPIHDLLSQIPLCHNWLINLFIQKNVFSCCFINPAVILPVLNAVRRTAFDIAIHSITIYSKWKVEYSEGGTLLKGC